MHAKMKYRIKNGVETENYDVAAKRFENTFRAIGFGFRGRGTPEGLLKARTNLSPTCEAELHGSVTRMPSSILSDIGT